jgi:hypothetical protein
VDTVSPYLKTVKKGQRKLHCMTLIAMEEDILKAGMSDMMIRTKAEMEKCHHEECRLLGCFAVWLL